MTHTLPSPTNATALEAHMGGPLPVSYCTFAGWLETDQSCTLAGIYTGRTLAPTGRGWATAGAVSSCGTKDATALPLPPRAADSMLPGCSSHAARTGPPSRQKHARTTTHNAASCADLQHAGLASRLPCGKHRPQALLPAQCTCTRSSRLHPWQRVLPQDNPHEASKHPQQVAEHGCCMRLCKSSPTAVRPAPPLPSRPPANQLQNILGRPGAVAAVPATAPGCGSSRSAGVVLRGLRCPSTTPACSAGGPVVHTCHPACPCVPFHTQWVPACRKVCQARMCAVLTPMEATGNFLTARQPAALIVDHSQQHMYIFHGGGPWPVMSPPLPSNGALTKASLRVHAGVIWTCSNCNCPQGPLLWCPASTYSHRHLQAAVPETMRQAACQFLTANP